MFPLLYQMLKGCNEVHVILDNPSRQPNTTTTFERRCRDVTAALSPDHKPVTFCGASKSSFLRSHALSCRSPALTATRRLPSGARIGEFHAWYHDIFLFNGWQQLARMLTKLLASSSTWRRVRFERQSPTIESTFCACSPVRLRVCGGDRTWVRAHFIELYYCSATASEVRAVHN